MLLFPFYFLVTVSGADELQKCVGGLLTTNATAPWNLYLPSPAIFTQPTTLNEISKILKCCQASKKKVHARSGGFGYSAGSKDAVTIDLSHFTTIQINNDTAWIGSAATHEAVYNKLSNEDLFLPLGDEPGLGFGPYVLGGGVSRFSRIYGLASDYLEEVDFVTYDGVIKRVSAKTDPDLFWALRGSGGGHLGLSVMLKVRLIKKNPDSFTELRWTPRPEMASDVLQWILDWSPPDQIGLRLTSQAHWFRVEFIGPKKQLFDSLLEELRETFPGETFPAPAPLEQFFTTLSPKHAYAKVSSLFLTPDRAITDSRILAAGRSPLVPCTVQLDRVGGPMLRKSSNEFWPQMDSSSTWLWRAQTISDNQLVDASVDWLLEKRDLLADFSAWRSSVNYLDTTVERWEDWFYGVHTTKLKGIQTRVDPNGTFDEGIARISVKNKTLVQFYDDVLD